MRYSDRTCHTREYRWFPRGEQWSSAQSLSGGQVFGFFGLGWDQPGWFNFFTG